MSMCFKTEYAEDGNDIWATPVDPVLIRNNEDAALLAEFLQKHSGVLGNVARSGILSTLAKLHGMDDFAALISSYEESS